MQLVKKPKYLESLKSSCRGLSAFVLAQKLVQARNLEEILKLQADYVRSQIEAPTEQARDIGKLANRPGPGGSSKA